MLCDIMKMNRSSYYKWLNRSKSQLELENEELTMLIQTLYAKYNGILGYRRMTMYINKWPENQYNHKRIYRLMSILGLKSVIRKKRPGYVKSTPQITAENILNRNFQANDINEKWLTDVTELKYGSNQKAYLSAILDLKDNRIVSNVMGHSNNNQLVFETFDLAVVDNPNATPIFHSDRGYQYTNKVFKTKLDEVKMIQSMSRAGRCIDNGPMEGFWGSLKAEMYYLCKFNSYDELKVAIDEYLRFYNYERLQAKLGCMAPCEYHDYILSNQ